MFKRLPLNNKTRITGCQESKMMKEKEECRKNELCKMHKKCDKKRDIMTEMIFHVDKMKEKD